MMAENTQDISSDLKGYRGDVFKRLNSVTLQAFKPPEEDTTKPFYFPSQIFRADIVVEHIEFILNHYHHGKTLEDFNDFEFQIYTARSNSLEEQTLMRLMERNAQCFGRVFYEKSKTAQFQQARKHVNQYVKSIRSDERNLKLLDQAKNNSQTLFLIVADEAHWGISDKGGNKAPGKEQEVDNESVKVEGAHNTFINNWNHEEYPNVIVLQISATPYNLLTSSSRLPNDVMVAKLQDNYSLVHVKKERNHVYAYTEGQHKSDVTGQIGPMRNLHCIEWSDGLVKDFQGGAVCRIQIPTDDGILWLKAEICQPIKNTNARKLVGTNDIEDSDEFIFETSNGSELKIYTADRKYKVVVTKDATYKKIVRMLPSEISHSYKIPVVDKFQLKLTFGEDIVEVYCPGTKEFQVDEMLCYHHNHINYNNSEITLARDPTEDTDDLVVKLFPRHDLKYQFIIYSWRRTGADVQDQQYLSLNHYYNSVRDFEPLLRDDPIFEKYKKDYKSKIELDALLIAEYAMFILLYGCLNELNIDKEFGSFSEILLSESFQNYFRMKRDKFEEFKKTLRLNETISDSDFDTIVSFYGNEASVKLDTPSQYSANGYSFEAFIWHILFINDKDSIMHLFGNDGIEFEPVNFNNLKHEVLDEIETYRIVKDLIVEIDDNQEEKEIKGHMKIIRVSKMEWGDKFHKTICNARSIQLPNEKTRSYFEVIRDYGNFRISDFHKDDRDEYMNAVLHRIRSVMQTPSCHNLSSKFEKCLCDAYVAMDANCDLKCRKCKHLHKNVNQYVDLNGLPCLLVLIDKGRLGDTFPDSMNTMDLRLNNKGTSQPYLTSVIQELGRMCRYVSKTKRSDYPYALLGSKLFSTLEKGLKKYVPMYGQFVHANRIDSRINIGENGLSTKEDHFDRNNTGKHFNRILLKAEPQIGKTGVFLNVIKQLREKIDRNNAAENEGDQEEYDYDDLDLGEESEDDTDDVEVEVNSTFSTSKKPYDRKPVASLDEVNIEEWKVPYWKAMTNGKILETYKPYSKYSKMYGPYVWRKEPRILKNAGIGISPVNRKNKAKLKEEYILLNQQYTAHKLEHNEKCLMCQKQAEVVDHVYMFKSNAMAGLSCELSIPKIPQYFPVFDKMGDGSYDPFSEGREVGFSTADLKSWIFMPTHRRHSVGNMNLAHTMVDSNDIPRNYVHILVVREEQFEIYSQYFKHSHCILKIPSNLPNSKMDCSQGGIGFSRRFIQSLAEDLHLKTFFMLDDSIPRIADITESKLEDGKVRLTNVPFLQVFQSIENQLLNQGDHPSVEFEPYYTDNGGGNNLSPLEQYTGPCKRYGIIGVMKLRLGSTRVKNPFVKSHVASLVGVNTMALKEKGIKYKPWPVFEDLNINNDCDDNQLWVCKYMRYQAIKRNLKSSIITSDVYFWDENTHLIKNRIAARKPPQNEEESALFWVKEFVRPTVIINSNAVNSPLKNITERFKDIQLKSGSNRLIIISEDADMNNIFMSKNDQFKNSRQHVMLIDSDFCERSGLLTVTNIQDRLKSFFEEEYFITVLTTHSVDTHMVKLVIVHVEGKAKTIQKEQIVQQISGTGSIASIANATPKQSEKYLEKSARTNEAVNVDSPSGTITKAEPMDWKSEVVSEQPTGGNEERKTDVKVIRKRLFPVKEENLQDKHQKLDKQTIMDSNTVSSMEKHDKNANEGDLSKVEPQTVKNTESSVLPNVVKTQIPAKAEATNASLYVHEESGTLNKMMTDDINRFVSANFQSGNPYRSISDASKSIGKYVTIFGDIVEVEDQMETSKGSLRRIKVRDSKGNSGKMMVKLYKEEARKPVTTESFVCIDGRVERHNFRDTDYDPAFCIMTTPYSKVKAFPRTLIPRNIKEHFKNI